MFSVDRFGKCGTPPPGCNGIDKQSDKCVAELVRPYKFYIAFENSNCVDYVTEKFFETLISRMAVPIVIKRAIYTNVGAPESSFIALDDFQTVDDMVKYIKEVAADKEKYIAFHKWRTSYESDALRTVEDPKELQKGIVFALVENGRSFLRFSEDWKVKWWHKGARPEHDDDTGFCELCRRLQQKTLGYMSYADVRKWHADGQCDNSLGARYIKH